jgi:hypothetical protein
VAGEVVEADVGTCSEMQQRRIMSSLIPTAAAARQSNSVIDWNSNAGCGGGPRMRTRQPIACKREVSGCVANILRLLYLACETRNRIASFGQTIELVVNYVGDVHA